MRLVVGFALVDHTITGLPGPPLARVIGCTLAAAAGVLLLAGLWTPIAGTLAVAVELWSVYSQRFSQTGDPLTHLLLVTLEAALVLLGPGAWSIDAHLFGWKRINIPNRKSQP